MQKGKALKSYACTFLVFIFPSQQRKLSVYQKTERGSSQERWQAMSLRAEMAAPQAATTQTPHCSLSGTPYSRHSYLTASPTQKAFHCSPLLSFWKCQTSPHFYFWLLFFMSHPNLPFSLLRYYYLRCHSYCRSHQVTLELGPFFSTPWSLLPPYAPRLWTLSVPLFSLLFSLKPTQKTALAAANQIRNHPPTS